jgi:hypothetical protein
MDIKTASDNAGQHPQGDTAMQTTTTTTTNRRTALRLARLHGGWVVDLDVCYYHTTTPEIAANLVAMLIDDTDAGSALCSQRQHDLARGIITSDKFSAARTCVVDLNTVGAYL